MVDLQNGYWMIKSMVGWQYFVMWLMPALGSVIGGYLGYWKQTKPFDRNKMLATVAAGLGGGLVFMLVLMWTHAPFHGALMGLGLLVGMGMAYLSSKFPVM